MNQLKTQVVEGLKELIKKAEPEVKQLPREIAGAAAAEAVKQSLSKLPSLGKTTISMTTLKPGFTVYVGSRTPTAGAEILAESAGGLVSGGAKGAAAAAAGSATKARVAELLGEAAAGPIGLGVSVATNILLSPQDTATDEEENRATSAHLNQLHKYNNSLKTLYKPNPDTAEARTVAPPGNARFRLRSLDQ